MSDTGELQRHYSRSTRRAVSQMARSLGIEPEKYLLRTDRSPDESLAALWAEVQAVMAGGVTSAHEQIVGDPFVVVLSAICQADHGGMGPLEAYYIVKTGKRVDEHEGAQIVARLKGEPGVAECEACHEPITTWQTDHCRLSTFQEAYKVTSATLEGRQRGALSPITITTEGEEAHP